MRMAPRDVVPIVHEGVRYDAPHWFQSQEVKPPELSVRERMLQALHEAGNPADPRPFLESRGFSADDIELMERHLAAEQVLKRVVTQSVQELILKSMSQGGPPNPMAAISPEWLLEALEKDGTLSAEQRQEAVSRFQASQKALQHGLQAAGGQNGGWLVASDEKGQLLWSLRVYEPAEGEDVFITSLEMDGEFVLVRDEKRREHRVDLKTRRVL